jgi:hypothetical protein
MADGHFPDVELLRRELAMLVLEWAGKTVKDDPDGPMSTALTRAVSEAARNAVTEQHQVLTAEAADRILEALERRSSAGGLVVWRIRPWLLGVSALAATALLAVTFFLGLQAGRTEGTLSSSSPAAATSPIAPLAPTNDQTARPPAAQSKPALEATAPPQRTTRPTAVAPASRPRPRELGRPAPAGDGASPRSTQPVGAATAPPPAPTPATTP